MGLFKRIISDNDNDMGQDNDNGRDQDNDHECNIVQPAGCSQGAWGARRHTGFQQKRSLKSHQSVIVWSEQNLF